MAKQNVPLMVQLPPNRARRALPHGDFVPSFLLGVEERHSGKNLQDVIFAPHTGWKVLLLHPMLSRPFHLLIAVLTVWITCWATPTLSQPNGETTSFTAAEVETKLRSIVIPEAQFRQAHIEEVRQFLSAAIHEARINDPDKREITIAVELPDATRRRLATDKDPFGNNSDGPVKDAELRVSLKISHTPLWEVLQSSAEQIRYECHIEGRTVTLSPRKRSTTAPSEQTHQHLTTANGVSLESVVDAQANEFAAMRVACETLSEQPLEELSLKTVLNTARSATNSDLRSRAMAICTLAAILRNDSDGYSRCFTALNSKFPEISVAHQIQPSKVSDVCSVCAGSGKGTATCPECKGNGNCIGCRGSGQVTRPQFGGPDYRTACLTCEGTGHCKYCQGKGKVPVICHNCGGRGQVLSQSKASDIYLQVVKETSALSYRLLHPEIGEVENAIQAAKAQDDFATALSILSEAIRLHPQSDNIDSAKELRSLLQDKQQIAQAAAREAADKLLRQQRQQLKEARDSSGRDSRDLPAAIKSVHDFIQNYPTSPYISEAKVLLQELEAKRKLVDSTGL